MMAVVFGDTLSAFLSLEFMSKDDGRRSELGAGDSNTEWKNMCTGISTSIKPQELKK